MVLLRTFILTCCSPGSFDLRFRWKDAIPRVRWWYVDSFYHFLTYRALLDYLPLFTISSTYSPTLHAPTTRGLPFGSRFIFRAFSLRALSAAPRLPLSFAADAGSLRCVCRSRLFLRLRIFIYGLHISFHHTAMLPLHVWFVPSTHSFLRMRFSHTGYTFTGYHGSRVPFTTDADSHLHIPVVSPHYLTLVTCAFYVVYRTPFTDRCYHRGSFTAYHRCPPTPHGLFHDYTSHLYSYHTTTDLPPPTLTGIHTRLHPAGSRYRLTLVFIRCIRNFLRFRFVTLLIYRYSFVPSSVHDWCCYVDPLRVGIVHCLRLRCELRF